MSDLLEDQKIHYIVKDYRRMYNNYWILKDIIKEQERLLDDKDREIMILKAKKKELESGSFKKMSGQVKNKMDVLECRSNALVERLRIAVEQLEKNMTNVEELRQLINV